MYKRQVWHWGEDTTGLEGYWQSERKLGIGGMGSIFRGGHRQENKKKKNPLDTARPEGGERPGAPLRKKVSQHGPRDPPHRPLLPEAPTPARAAPFHCTKLGGGGNPRNIPALGNVR